MIKLFMYTFILQISLLGHSMVFNAIDNEDGTMEVEGMFSTGASTEGAKLKIVSLASNEVLFEQRMPASGTITLKIPQEAYKLILDSGPGHVMEKIGDVEPANGFQKVVVKNINFAFYSTLIFSMIFILSAFVLQLKRVKT